ncbi:hypothetical protein GR160_18055 [Flavobacterium sp. Sd200]|uniref:patatin-like phospholipase family protein n=1 Tax=Flavobacterium sp. Sd200 TaxID=2692211 RepID=UPI0013715E6D|nr:patatin-like phospholipase family protein [Flavobacterium sp. Sd200]MXN93135.1 hypothetical protein [Flavobacterium sp. Sd200]
MKNIALAFSGGGFRAAAFSLGTLSYLNKAQYNNIPLLHNVKFIGSASGGSITNLAYSLSIAQGKSFDDFYFELMDAMEGEKLIAKAFEILKDNSYWKTRAHKNRNLINAFAIAYDEMLFNKVEFGALNNTYNAGNCHIEQVCVNATEFANGLSFRFQSKHKNPDAGSGLLGNHFINISDDTIANKIKLGDILASSSCFPGGFEPLIYPDDFMHEKLDTKELTDALNYRDNPFTNEINPEDIGNAKEPKDQKQFALMDGGIADNQAIGSVNLAAKRNKDNPFDLLLITDVSSYFINAYSTPKQVRIPLGKYSVRQIGFTTALLLLLFIVTVLAGIILKLEWLKTVLLIVAVIIPILFILPKFRYLFKQKANEEDGTWKLMVLNYGRYFLQLPLNALLLMLFTRLKSVFLMTTDIYLKQIRRKYYEQLFEDASSPETVVANAIYDLSRIKDKVASKKIEEDVKDELGYDPENPDKKPKNNLPAPSPIIRYVAEEARKAATTLWFDPYQQKAMLKEIIVATGQFTTCYNLLKHLKKRKNLPTDDTQAIAQLQLQLEKDWNNFNKDPFWLFNEGQKNRQEPLVLSVIKTGADYKVVKS